MTLDEALSVVCETAEAWAGEYGFAVPDEATKVLVAAETVRRELHIPADEAVRRD